MGGGLVRCVGCGEVQWNLRGHSDASATQGCRVCGSELRVERRRPGRRFAARFPHERRNARPPAKT